MQFLGEVEIFLRLARRAFGACIPHAGNFELCLSIAVNCITMEVSKIQDSISILITLQSAIGQCLPIIEKERNDRTSVIFAITSSQLMLYVNSFLDEWEHFGNQCKDEARVIKVRKIASPFVRRIRQWDDLNSIRNTFIAHNFRDRNKNNALLKRYENELKIPNGFSDYTLMCGCIYLIKEIVITEFSKEYNELIVHLRTIKKPEVSKGIKSDTLAADELNKLASESDLIRLTYCK